MAALKLFTNLTPRLTVAYTGQVGIGTTTPGQELSVNGVIQSIAGGFQFPDGTVQITAGLTSLPNLGGDLNGPITNAVINSGAINSAKLARDTASLNPVSGGAMQSDGTSVSVAGNFSAGANIQSNTLATNGITDNGNASFGGLISAPSATIPALNGTVRVSGNFEVKGPNGGGGGLVELDAVQGHGYNNWKMDAYSNGNFRIYDTNADELYLTPGGLLHINGALQQNSDVRYKTNVRSLDNSLESLLGLRGVSYNWDRARWPNRKFSGGKQIGFIAQEMEKIFPELVSTDENSYKSVNYIGVVPVLVEAVKAQQKQIDELTKQNARLASLKAENDAMRADIRSLAADMKRFRTNQNVVRAARR